MAIRDFIRAQPEVLDAVQHAVPQMLRDWQPPDCRKLTLIGSGTSLHALLAAAPGLAEALGVPVETIGPGRYLSRRPRPAAPGEIVVVLSQSGASTTSVAAAQAAVASGAATLVLTGEASSPIAAVAGARLVTMPIGPEPIGPKTKGYTASLAALQALRHRLDVRAADVEGAHLDAPDVEAAREAAEQLAASLDAVDYVLIAGSGRHMATALEASLKISEIAGLPASGFDTEEALHGRFHALGANSLAILIAADAAELALARHTGAVMAERGVRLRIVNLTAEATAFDWLRACPLPTPLDTVSAILPLQWLAALLAERRGLDPDAMRFPGLSKALAIKLAS